MELLTRVQPEAEEVVVYCLREASHALVLDSCMDHTHPRSVTFLAREVEVVHSPLQAEVELSVHLVQMEGAVEASMLESEQEHLESLEEEAVEAQVLQEEGLRESERHLLNEQAGVQSFALAEEVVAPNSALEGVGVRESGLEEVQASVLLRKEGERQKPEIHVLRLGASLADGEVEAGQARLSEHLNLLVYAVEVQLPRTQACRHRQMLEP